jgi:three-Cys-motif partner protein
MDEAKVRSLEAQAIERQDVTIHHGDCNDILLKSILPRIRFDEYKRAICLLDPYSLQLDWEVIARAGEMKSIEIFLNFPIMDMNRNVLRKNASAEKERKMSRFWGDESWRDAAYRPQQTLFFGNESQKVGNPELVEAFRQRLLKSGRFSFVPKPLAMRNSNHAAVYYLFFAGQNETGANIVNWIFNHYRDKGYG